MSLDKKYPNIRAEIPKRKGIASQKSIVLNREYYDCVNINGPVDNSSCPSENQLCKCPCTGADEGTASAVPLFREPTDVEMEWAKTQINGCSDLSGSDNGYFILEPDALESSCGVNCHGENYYSTFRALRTYSTYWATPKEVPLYRNALVNLYTAQQAVCIIPGNLNVRVGEFINIPSDGSPIAEEYSGCWLISNIRHAIASLQNYKMILTLIRDSRIEEK